MNAFRPRRIVGSLLLAVLVVLAISPAVWAGPATAWWQVALDISMATCRARSVLALQAAGYSDIQRDPDAFAASDGPVSAWLICYSLGSSRTLLTVLTASDNFDAAKRMRDRLRDYMRS